MKKIISSFLLLFASLVICSNQLIAGGTGSLRGFVTDSTNGEYIIYANVVVQGTSSGSPTDTRGYYFIPAIPVGKQTIIISHINYKTKYIVVDIKENKITRLDVILSPKNIELQGVNVIGRNETKPTEVNLGLEKISIKELEMIPSGAEPDVFRALQTMSGVTTTGDVTSKYYVRGGGGDQNLVLFNGATIYNPFHAMGIFSVIDPEMISTVEFYKGGFNADYGGRISSILNIVTKDGNKNSYHATGSASLLSGKLAFEGPIPYGSFIVTGRKSYFSEILKKYLNDQSAPFDFYDISFKVNYGNPNILQNGKFILYGFASGDAVKNNDPLLEDYTVKNNILGMTWNQVWSSPLFSVINLSYSGYRAELLPNLSDAKARMNKLDDITADFDFTYVYENKDEMDFGLQNKFLNIKLRQENLYNSITDFNQSGWDLTGFINYRFYRWDKLGVELGMRSKFLALSQGRPFIFEPRINVTYRPIPLLAVKASVGRYSQEVTTLTTENDIISLFEPWIIIPNGVGAPEASELSLGLEAYLTSQLELDLTGYYKYITNLLESNQTRYALDANEFMNVNGKSYGLEFSTKFQNDLLYLKTNYSLGWAYKMYGDVRYYPRYDIRHSVNILAGINLGKGWEANATWSLRSGMPFTPIAGFYDRMPIDNVWSNYIFETYKAVVYWGEINSARLPYYHRLDLSLARKFKIYLADVSLEASILNVYNRKNIFYFDRDTGKKVYMLPFFPSVSLKVEL
ncbi:MAG: TonB-dependent receptor [Bacteroidetes bacterium]|nr:TonB-dependent receptor [Bacteroidota bacterium]